MAASPSLPCRPSPTRSPLSNRPEPEDGGQDHQEDRHEVQGIYITIVAQVGPDGRARGSADDDLDGRGDPTRSLIVYVPGARSSFEMSTSVRTISAIMIADLITGSVALNRVSVKVFPVRLTSDVVEDGARLDPRCPAEGDDHVPPLDPGRQRLGCDRVDVELSGFRMDEARWHEAHTSTIR